MNRVVIYIDGFNLYFGLRSKGWRRFYWLDVHQLSQNLLRSDQQLIGVKYFTSRVSATPSDPGKDKRQNAYLEAVAALPLTTVFFGHYLSKAVRCRNCGSQWNTHEEKMTDVNIAVQMLGDAYQDRFDTALLLSADSDLTMPVESVISLFPGKRVVTVFPPDRTSERLKRAASAWFRLGRATIGASQLPNPVTSPNGFPIHKPAEWT